MTLGNGIRRRLLGVGLVASVLVIAGAAPAELSAAVPPTRAEYIAQVEPICQASGQTMKRIQRGTAKDFRSGRKARAGRKVLRAAKEFGRGVDAVGQVPQPTDAAVIGQWVDSLRDQVKLMKDVAKAVIASPPSRTSFTPRHNRAARKHQRNARHTNKLVDGFGFDSCLL